jgi:hypothetical protein
VYVNSGKTTLDEASVEWLIYLLPDGRDAVQTVALRLKGLAEGRWF